jgi:ABC-type dipeptide/oligopeptide/nickel transport system ATPase component
VKTVIEAVQLELGYRTRSDGSGEGRKAVGPVSFYLSEGECLGLIGESGAGKSTVALEVLGLLRYRGGVRLSGELVRNVPGNRIAYIPQDPLSAMDPLCSIGALFRAAGSRAEDARGALEQVRLPLNRISLNSYPHELSGGMRQRVLIALALARKASLIVADEPTSSLDVTVQAGILDLFSEIKKQGVAFLLVTHNVPIAKNFCDRVAVMRQGSIVESGAAGQVLGRPAHSYTRALLEAVPSLRRGGPAV